jgi:hypothetical protein
MDGTADKVWFKKLREAEKERPSASRSQLGMLMANEEGML